MLFSALRHLPKWPKPDFNARVFDLGGTVAAKYSSDVTHLLCNDAELAKRSSAKVKAVLAHNAREDVPRIWVVDQAWLEETEDQGERPLEEEWDLELNLDEEDAKADEEERQERQKKAEERKRKRDEAEAEQPAGGVTTPSTGAQVDEAFPQADNAHIHTVGGLPLHTYLVHKDQDKGTEKFCLIQVLKSDTSNLYWTHSRTGKLRTQGKSHTSAPYGQPHLALAAFDKKFKEKTKLAWKDRWAPAQPDVFQVVEPVQTDELELLLDDDFDLDDAAFAELDALEASHGKSSIQKKEPEDESVLHTAPSDNEHGKNTEIDARTAVEGDEAESTEQDVPKEEQQPAKEEEPSAKRTKVENGEPSTEHGQDSKSGDVGAGEISFEEKPS